MNDGEDEKDDEGRPPGAEVELAPSGAPIYRYQERDRKWQLPDESCVHLDVITTHVERYVGPVDHVFHELVSDLIHLDVLVCLARPERPYHLLITSGVSDKPMNAPPGAEDLRLAELVIALPESWPLDEQSFEDEKNYWPVRWLKLVGRLPHEYETWIGWGHTIPNGDPPEKLPGTDFIGVMLDLPYGLPVEFARLPLESGDTLNFYTLIPLHSDEMSLKLREGAEKIADAFQEKEIPFPLDVHRPSIVKKKRFWVF